MAGANARVDAPLPPETLPAAHPVGKPPYRVPTMAELAEVPWNGLRVVSTFSGCGGSCLGFRMAGYRVAWASEFVAAARETYRANHPTPHVDERDIRSVTAEDILGTLGIAKGELDVFEGSPPCASFSMAGKREKLWGQEKQYSDRKQRTDDLFTEWLRLLGGLMPRAFVAENVAGLVIGTAKGHFLEIVKQMRALGYRVAARLLDAQWLGVPQARRRVIFIGIREDLGVDPPHPRPLPYRYSIRDALPWLGGGRVVHDTSGLYGAGDVTDRPSPAVTVGVNSLNSRHFQVHEPTLVTRVNSSTRELVDRSVDLPSPTVLTHGRSKSTMLLREPEIRFTGGFSAGAVPLDGPAPTVMAAGIGGSDDTQLRISGAPTEEELASVDFSRYAIGREWERLAQGQGSEKYLNLQRSHPDRPCPTVTATAGTVATAGVAHPSQPRKFTIAELRRLCGFPDDFVLTGTYAQQWERLGRAVPPPMMAAVARELAVLLLAAGGR